MTKYGMTYNAAGSKNFLGISLSYVLPRILSDFQVQMLFVLNLLRMQLRLHKTLQS